MKTCKYCKFWLRGGHYSHGKIWEEHVLSGNGTADWGMCTHRKIKDDCRNSWRREGMELEPDGICAECDEERGCLTIGPDFGCLHWESKA